MKTKKKDTGWQLCFLIIAFYAIIFGSCFLTSAIAGKYYEKKELKMWNNGYCTCGEPWVYEQAVGHKSETRFMYHCDNCNNYIELKERY